MIDFTDEQKMVRKMVRQWAEKELAPHVAAMEKGEITPYAIARKLLTTFGMDEMVRTAFANMKPDADKPEKPAGMGSDPAMGAIVAMELSRICPGFALAFGASLGLAGGAIAAKGTYTQKQKYALPILTGEKIGAWSMTEPDAGSDAFGSMRTVARRDGDHFVLNGQKTFITNAPFADIFVIYAKIAETAGDDIRHRPIHAFIVERGAAGLTTSKPMEKMGMHSSPTGEIFSPTSACTRATSSAKKIKIRPKSRRETCFTVSAPGWRPCVLATSSAAWTIH